MYHTTPIPVPYYNHTSIIPVPYFIEMRDNIGVFNDSGLFSDAGDIGVFNDTVDVGV